MTSSFTVRRASVADAPAIARHRAEMFRDMGTLPDPLYENLVAATVQYLEELLPTEEYVGWVATPGEQPQVIAGGAGILNRRVPPHPYRGSDDVTIAAGRQGIVLNVFTERPWRRRGVARLLMSELLDWAARRGLETVVLHASDEGRPLYELLGFIATNEMRYPAALLQSRRG